jgi:hypothetical protein
VKISQLIDIGSFASLIFDWTANVFGSSVIIGDCTNWLIKLGI